MAPVPGLADEEPQAIRIERLFVPAAEWGTILQAGGPRRYLSMSKLKEVLDADLRHRRDDHRKAVDGWQAKRSGLGRAWYAEGVRYEIRIDPDRFFEVGGALQARQPKEDEAWKPASARVRASFRIKVLTKGWHRLRLLSGPIAIRNLEVDGAAAQLLPAGTTARPMMQQSAQQAVINEEPLAQPFDLLLHDEGDRRVTLDFDVSVRELDFYHALSFDVLPAPTGSLELLLPSGRLEVACDACLNLEKKEARGITTVRAPLVPTERLSLQWFRLSRHAEQAVAPEEEKDGEKKTESFALREAPLESPQLLAELLQEAAVGEGRIGGRLTVAATIRRAPLDRIIVNLPPHVGHVNLEAQPELVASHRKDGQKLEILFRSPRQGDLTLALDYAVEEGSSSFEADVPLFRLENATRQSTWVAVHRRTNVRIRTLLPPPTGGEEKEANLLEAVPLEALPQVIRNLAASYRPLSIYRAFQDPSRLRLEVTRYPDALVQDRVVDLARATTVFTPDGGRLNRITWWMRSQGRDFLTVDRSFAHKGGEGTLVVETVTVSGQAASLKEDEHGRLLIPLKAAPADGAMRAFPVEITYRQRRAALPRWGRIDHELVAIDAPILELHWTWKIPEDLACHDFGGNVLAYRSAPYLQRPSTLVYSARQERSSGHVHEDPLASLLSKKAIQFYQKAIPASSGDGVTGRIRAGARVLPGWLPTALSMGLFILGLWIGALAARVLFRGERPGRHLTALALAFVAVALFQDVEGFASSLLGGVGLYLGIYVMWNGIAWGLGLAWRAVTWPLRFSRRQATTPEGTDVIVTTESAAAPSSTEADPVFVDDGPDRPEEGPPEGTEPPPEATEPPSEEEVDAMAVAESVSDDEEDHEDDDEDDDEVDDSKGGGER